MRIGKSHQDVAIILLGAFSRYVNQLQDEDMTKPGTKVLLKALRKSRYTGTMSLLLMFCYRCKPEARYRLWLTNSAERPDCIFPTNTHHE